MRDSTREDRGTSGVARDSGDRQLRHVGKVCHHVEQNYDAGSECERKREIAPRIANLGGSEGHARPGIRGEQTTYHRSTECGRESEIEGTRTEERRRTPKVRGDSRRVSRDEASH